MLFIEFLCTRCEVKYPRREANLFSNRRTFRKHLKVEHNKYGFSHKKSGDEKIVLDEHHFIKLTDAIRIYTPM